MKDVGLVIKMPTEQCSDKERDYIRVRYIAKLIQWKQAEIEEQRKIKRVV